jgi:hypothetical protein
VEKARSLTLERKKRFELFRANVANQVQNVANGPGYSASVEAILTGLGLEMGKSIGHVKPPFTPLKGLQGLEGLLQFCEPCHLPELYQDSLEVRPTLTPNAVEWVANTSRRDAGSFFTPPGLVDTLLKFIWTQPSHASTARQRPLRPPQTHAVEAKTRLGKFTICDPSCGAGAFLIAAAKALAETTKKPIGQIVKQSIFGCDNDPVVLKLCRLMIWLETGESIPQRNLVCADAFAMDWQKAFPDVFDEGGFDAIVGNPPFGGVVDGKVPSHIKESRRARFPELGGTADLSAYFVSLGTRLIKPSGRMAMVLPRAFLGSRATHELRNMRDRECIVLESCASHDSFDGAAVYVCLLGFQKRKAVTASVIARQEPAILSVTASLTVSEAYDLARSVIDHEHRGGQKLLTTGLIEPNESLWGQVTCRYLKSKYKHPRAPEKSLKETRRVISRKPKLIVAGLSRTPECFLDEAAEYVGSVGTYTITHPSDDCRILRRAMKRLHSKEISERFRAELGYAALGGGNITLTKRFLRQVLAEAGF